MLGLQRLTGNVTVRLSRRVLFRGKASVATEPQGQGQLNAEKVEVKKPAPEQQNKNKQKGTLVAAAFQSLKDEIDKNSSNLELNASSTAADAKIDERIINAKSVNGLLAITDGNGPLSRKHALKIVSILAEWSSINRVKLAEFENDQRFLRICRMLGRTLPKSNGNATNNNSNNNNNGVSQKRITGFRTDDLNTVLGVAGDDEAAKLIASISLPQMVKVMSALAQKKRRSTPLLRSLAFNISSSTDVLDIKQCADVLFAMATLNFQDSVLSAKVCADIQLGLTKLTDKSAVVGSILTSLGILRYRDLDILESLTQWSLKHSDICRPQDLSALFLSSAMLNFKSTNLEDVRAKLARIIVPEDFPKKYDWLNHVWALSMLGIVDQQQLDSVLNESFVKQLEDKSALTPTSKMKLLNLNSYAILLAKDYKGSVLAANSSVYNVPMAHSKSKQVLLNGMLDALKSLLPANNHVQNLVDSKMGFLIDAVCQFDSKRNPVPLDKTNPDTIKVALMVIDFHDVCQGTHRSASGITNLTFDLLEKSGYKILPVPYNEFNTSDKLLKRVQYLDNKFKALITKQQKQ